MTRWVSPNNENQAPDLSRCFFVDWINYRIKLEDRFLAAAYGPDIRGQDRFSCKPTEKNSICVGVLIGYIICKLWA